MTERAAACRRHREPRGSPPRRSPSCGVAVRRGQRIDFLCREGRGDAGQAEHQQKRFEVHSRFRQTKLSKIRYFHRSRPFQAAVHFITRTTDAIPYVVASIFGPETGHFRKNAGRKALRFRIFISIRYKRDHAAYEWPGMSDGTTIQSA